MMTIEVKVYVFILLAYNLYKATGTHEGRVSDEQVREKLDRIQNELESLKEEGETRFQIHKYHSSDDEINQSNHMLRIIQDMQNTVQSYFSSEVLKDSKIGEEVADIMKNDPNLSINTAISRALAEIVSNTLQKSKLDEDPDTDIDFQILLKAKESDTSFVTEFCDLEEEIAKIEKLLGRPDVYKHPSIKATLMRIIDQLPKPDPKTLDKCKQQVTVLKKELMDITKSYNGMLFQI